MGHKRRFAYYFKPHFAPHKGTSYSLIGDDAPDWLKLNNQGRLFASVPEFDQDQIIRFGVQAKNPYGSATQECLLIVSTKEPFDLDKAIRMHKKAVTNLSGTLTASHDLLEFIYYYLVSYNKAQLDALISKRALELDVDIPFPAPLTQTYLKKLGLLFLTLAQL